MIMQWKEQADNSFVAVWQGLTYKLAQLPGVIVRWQLFCDGKSVKGTWPKPKIAMQQIDSRQQKLIMAASKTGGAHANQTR